MPAPQPQLASLFSGRLRTARALRDLSQRDLGRQAGLQPSSIAQFEAGARMPTIESLRRLGSALNVPTDFLLGLIDIPGLMETGDVVGRDIGRLSNSPANL